MKIPFTNLNSEARRRLAIAAVLALYLITFEADLFQRRLFGSIGLDYLGFWSVGKIADELGFSRIYQLSEMARVQSDQLTQCGLPIDKFHPVPVPFLSVFILVFQGLSRLEARWSFWVWTLSNLAILIGYLLFFVRRLSKAYPTTKNLNHLLVLLLASYPVFQNFYWGQVEVALVICAGEFIRATLEDKPIRSGVWLAGMLIKPQILILAVPALVMMKNWKALSGFLAAAGAILAASVLLSGPEGSASLIDLLFRYVPGIATNAPEKMTNWRMLALHINHWTASSLGWPAAGAGMLFCLAIWFFLCRQGSTQDPRRQVMAWCGIFAVTLAFTWHAHIHMAMALIPFLMYAAIQDFLPIKFIEGWVFLAPLIILVVYGIALLMVIGPVPFIFGFGSFAMGFTWLLLNLWLAASCVKLFLFPKFAPQSKQAAS